LSKNNNSLNSDSSNIDSKIKNLQNEIDYLNSKIIDMFKSINTLDTFPGIPNEIMKVLKGIIISQRKEIMLKTKQIKKFELDFSNLIAENNQVNNTYIKEENGMKVFEDTDLNVGELKITIEELLKKNAENQEIINKLQDEGNVEFWENEISVLNKEIIDLNDENSYLRDELEKAQNNNINENFDKKISKLKNQMKYLEEENNKLEEKNRMLKAALLMTVDTETKNITDSPESLTEDSEIELQSEDKKSVYIPEGPITIKSWEEKTESSDRKRQCPKCGASGAFILEIDDKSTIIYQDMDPKIYGKKYKCGDCRYEWK